VRGDIVWGKRKEHAETTREGKAADRYRQLKSGKSLLAVMRAQSKNGHNEIKIGIKRVSTSFK